MDVLRAVLCCDAMKRRCSSLFCLVWCLAWCLVGIGSMTAQANADSRSSTAFVDPQRRGLTLEGQPEEGSGSGLSSILHPYLWDGGAVPFLWGTMAARIAMDRWVPANNSSLGFSTSEGGASVAAWEVPGWAVTATGGALGLAMALGEDEARWYHVKGLAETMATGAFVTGALKLAFSRQRPDYSGDASGGFGGGNRSFPSGHSTQAFEVATYAVLYLRSHGFDNVRPHGTFRWWEGVAYAGIYGAAGMVAGERVYHHRHHLTDVVAGAALGTATSALFFLYQERRYQASRSLEKRAFLISPQVSSEDVGVKMQWTY
jgi:hypothetical protein